ncbi:PepSY-like domain-containing protein [uncultured Rikenella sp.]|uniref:PepSY-like domain-containing protein n=1 Tax=uncultured Rikenella sp. TaxID=368003 RepID=UPI002614451E|nr:PepSY-like domain-containing protein [uncultured Rikenella sp.]
MKKLFFTLLFGAALGTTVFASPKSVATSDKNAAAIEKTVYTTDPTTLPTQAQAFLRKHFSTLTVHQIKVENEAEGREYDVKLAGGCEIDFDHRGEWTQVDCGRTAVPTSVLPERIARYVADHYPRQFVVSIERDADKYEVELSDKTDLEFDLRGDFLRID